MRLFLALALALALALVLSAALLAMPLQAADLLKGDAPAWVDDIALPEVDEKMLPYVGDGLYYLLSEEQDLWQGERRLSHERIAVKVLSRAGLESAASFLRDFDPGTETLTLTRLDIVRDGQRTSVRDQVVAEILRREGDLDQGMINGMLTAHLEVPGLKVGDVLDAGFLWQTDPLFAGQTFAGAFSHEYSTPVGLSRLVLNWPEDRPILLGPDLAGMQRTDTSAGGIRRIELTQTAHVPLEPEDDLLPEADPWKRIYYTAARSWADVAAPLAGFYGKTRSVPPPWQAQLTALSKSRASDLARGYAALRLVQDQVRYVGVEVGAGGYFAREPQQVVENGYGDCKDKAVLLVTLLRALNIEADVALADLNQGYGLGDHLPMAGAFDHMIVRAVIGGKPVWMDGTASYQAGDMTGAVTPEYGFALPLTGKFAGRLVRINPAPVGSNLRHTHETFTFREGVLDLDVVTIAKGAEADQLRWIWASTPRHVVEEAARDYYDASYPGIATRAPMTLVDRPEINQITLLESYRLSSDALSDPDLTSDFPFEADGFGKVLPDIPAEPRAEPLYIGTPAERVHEVTVIGASKALSPPDPVLIDSAAFRYAFEGTVNVQGTLHLLWHFTPLARSVAAADAEAFSNDTDQMGDSLRKSWDVTAEQGFLTSLLARLKTRAANAAPTP